jgi:hypothetical protein
MNTALSIALMIAFLGILVGILALLALKASVPPDSSAGSKLFRAGAIHPYTTIRSLHAKYLFPWVATPDLPSSARRALIFARVGFSVSAVSLPWLIAIGLAGT